MSRSHAPDSDGKRRVDVDVHPDVLLDESLLREVVARRLGVASEELAAVEVEQRGIDARRGRVRVQLRVAWRHQADQHWKRDVIVAPVLPNLDGAPAVAIAGAGPAGMFCAWALARAGIRPIVLERGKEIAERRRDIARLSRDGSLDPESNYCFGEGGAGTFSDGKLYTRANKRGPVREVLKLLVGLGAPAEILIDRRPHIGTNRLPRVVTAMREYLEAAGVVFAFQRRVDGVELDGSRLVAVRLADGDGVPVSALVVATGHSAADVWRWLSACGVEVSSKPFAMGVRVEHPQSVVDQMQFGALAGHPALGAASYRLVLPVEHGSVYSFCMCPGGYVVPAATRPGMQVVNGMSPSQRRGKFANSGFVAEVSNRTLVAAGLSVDDSLAGVRYQESLERRAYAAGGGSFVAPAQGLSDFLAGRLTTRLPPTSYHRGVVAAELRDVLGELDAPIRTALSDLSRKLPAFLDEHAIAVGVESRTSAPVRVERDAETLEARGVAGLYPCGEGAGFAGGIVSAALDGVRVGEAVARRIGARARR